VHVGLFVCRQNTARDIARGACRPTAAFSMDPYLSVIREHLDIGSDSRRSGRTGNKCERRSKHEHRDIRPHLRVGTDTVPSDRQSRASIKVHHGAGCSIPSRNGARLNNRQAWKWTRKDSFRRQCECEHLATPSRSSQPDDMMHQNTSRRIRQA